MPEETTIINTETAPAPGDSQAGGAPPKEGVGQLTPDIYEKVEKASPEVRDKFWKGEDVEIDAEGKVAPDDGKVKAESEELTQKELAYLQAYGITDAKSFDEILAREKSRREELTMAHGTLAKIDQVAKKVGLDRESFITWLAGQDAISANAPLVQGLQPFQNTATSKWLDGLGEGYKRQDARFEAQVKAGKLESYDPVSPGFDEQREYEIARHNAYMQDVRESVAPLHNAINLLSDRLNVQGLPEQWENLPEKVRVYHEKNRHELTNLIMENKGFFHLKNRDGTARNPYYPAIATFGKNDSVEAEAQRVQLSEADKLETKRRIMNRIEGTTGSPLPTKKTNVFSGEVPPANAPTEVHKAYQEALSKEAARQTREALGAGVGHRRR